MIKEDSLRTEVDWEIPQEDFQEQIRRMIATCREQKKVIVLPVLIQTGPAFMYQLAMLISQVNCEKCEAPCCKIDFNPNQVGIALFEADCDTLNRLNQGCHIEGEGTNAHLPLPCPLLKHNRCHIYPDRPFICIMYPWQPGGSVTEHRVPAMSIASECPEGRRIAKQVYMMAWRLRQRFGKVTKRDLELLK